MALLTDPVCTIGTRTQRYFLGPHMKDKPEVNHLFVLKLYCVSRILGYYAVGQSGCIYVFIQSCMYVATFFFTELMQQ